MVKIDDIPDRISPLIYTPHAILEQRGDIKGVIDCVPKQFIKIGCKKVEPDPKGHKYIFRATYIFNDTRDLILVIDKEYNRVITNFLKFANNVGVYKGRYKIKSIIKTK